MGDTICGDIITSPGLGYTIKVGEYNSFFQTIHGIDSFQRALGLSSSSSNNDDNDEKITLVYRTVESLDFKNKLCIFYGDTSKLDNEQVEELNNFDIIILKSKQNTELQRSLIQAGKQVFGYVLVGNRALPDIASDIESWTSMTTPTSTDKSVTGIFCDVCGSNVTDTPEQKTAKQTLVVTMIETLRIASLGFILNAENPDDLFEDGRIVLNSNSNSNSNSNIKEEFYLFEGFGIADSVEITCSSSGNIVYENFVRKVNKIVNKYKIENATLATTTNTLTSVSFNQDLFNEYYYMALLMGLTSFYWAELNFLSINSTRSFTGNPARIIPSNNSIEKKNNSNNTSNLLNLKNGIASIFKTNWDQPSTCIQILAGLTIFCYLTRI